MFKGAIIAGLLLVSATSVSAKSVQQEFKAAWVEREAIYQADEEKSQAALIQSIEAFNDNIGVSEEEDKRDIFQMLDVTQDLGYRQGRLVMIQSLIAFMETKPSPSRMEMWLQEQTDTVKLQEPSIRAQYITAAEMDASKEPEGGIAIVKAHGLARLSHGQFLGQVDELLLINQNVNTYFSALSAQDQRRAAKRADFFARLGAAARSFDAPQSNNWSATCTQMGMFTNCHGN